ncbi:uncharacterized protein [Dysidea avara]|uniref:uncharacterized protein n=1 Tax=Dysidea avara TaxID=196820 RepID=UPI0033187A76
MYIQNDDNSVTATTTSAGTSTTAIDSRGIPDWEKVAQLAEALLELKGLSLPNDKVQNIKALWNAMDPFDKKATEIILKSQVQLRGHFSSQKKTGHTTTEQMKRCLLSGVSVPLSPLKSRIVEALCILLTTRHGQSKRTTDANGKRRYVSRWDLVLQDYSALHARLYNSLNLLEGTNLALYTINTTTW